MKARFVFIIASRYFKTKRRSQKISSSLLSTAGIAVGIMTLIAVLSIMNGFQLSFIGPILEVKSYHVLLTEKSGEEIGLSALVEHPEILSAIPFREIQGIVGMKRVCTIRGIPLNALELDRGFADSFSDHFDSPGRENLEQEGSIVIGEQLAAQLNVRKGDTLGVMTASGSSLNDVVSNGRTFTVTGIYKTGFYEIDLNWAFISMDTARSFSENKARTIGVKLRNRYRDLEVVRFLKQRYPDHNVKSWREYNQVFFGALRTEKALMMLLVGLIFVVVGFNIHHSLRRSVYERYEEIATLKAVGASDRTIRSIFISEGVLIGFTGGFVGTILGLLIALNINPLFHLIERLVNQLLLPVLEIVLSPIASELSFIPLSIFSPTVFYIDEVPSQVLLPEVLFIVLFAFLCSMFAAAYASKRVSQAKPAVIMRNE